MPANPPQDLQPPLPRPASPAPLAPSTARPRAPRARRRTAAGAALLALLGVVAAGCDKPCDTFCERVQACLSKKQKKRLFTSVAECRKNCGDWKLDKHAKRCLDRAEGSCYRLLKCMGPAVRSAIQDRQKRRRRRAR